jgi:hypothetical protein
LNVTNPAPADLNLNLFPSPITPPGQATLTITDLHAPGPLVPGAFYSLPIVASGGGITRTTTVNLLVGGTQTYLPLIRK